MLIVTLQLDERTQNEYEALRRRYYPAERNVVPAHVSLFHALPPEQLPAISEALRAVTIGPKFAVPPVGLKRLGSGVAYALDSPPLHAVHAALARRFAPWLTAQDRQPFRPHVVVQNKAARDAAAATYDELRARALPSEGIAEALLLWHYRNGPWTFMERFAFA